MNIYCPPSFWKGKKIIFGLAGGISAYKVAGVISFLVQAGADIQTVMTHSAQRFIGASTLSALTRKPVYTDLFEEGDRILHITLVRENDQIVVAPATANIIGKMASGIADDLLSTCLCVDPQKVILVPAMNTGMWENPIVQENVQKLLKIGVRIISPGIGTLACGEQGAGRLPEPEEFIENIFYLTYQPHALSGKKVLITAGPTREWMDPVRYITNSSSGFMGCSLSALARAQGAKVTMITGPLSVRVPTGIEVIPVTTALQMQEAVFDHFDDCEICIMNAAVSDYRPLSPSSTKLKKQGKDELLLSLVSNPDILFELGKRKKSQILIGFCAETENIVAEASRKMIQKNCDVMIANLISPGKSGFEVTSNKAWLLNQKNETIDLPLMTKIELAEAIFQSIVSTYFP